MPDVLQHLGVLLVHQRAGGNWHHVTSARAVTSEERGRLGLAGRAGFTILLGSAGGFGLALILTPVISRLYAPSVFGTFAVVTALVAVFVGLSTFRLEVLAQRSVDDAEAERLLHLAVLTALGWGVAVGLVSGVVVLVTDVGAYLLTTGPLVTIASLQLVGSARLTRERRYRELAGLNFAQGAGTAVLQVVAGWIAGTAGSLIAGFAAARLVWLTAVRGLSQAWRTRHAYRRSLTSMWRKSRRYAAVSGCAAAINSVGSQLPLLLSSLLFGQAEVGFLAMAIRLLVAPMAIVGQAAAVASVGEIGQLLRQQDPAAPTMVCRGMWYLLALGALPCAAASVVGPWLVPWLLGPEWAQTGHLLFWLALGTLAQFAVAPFSQMLNLTGHHAWMLCWDACRLLVVGLAMTLPAAFGQPLDVAVAAYSLSSVVLYAILGFVCTRAVASPQ